MAIGRTVIVVIAIIVIIIAAAGAVALSQTKSTTTTSLSSNASTISSPSSVSTSSSSLASSAESSSATSTSSPPSTSISSTSSTSFSSSAKANQTLTIDDAFFPDIGLNIILPGVEYPEWMDYTVYQTLINVNVSLEWTTGEIQFLPGLASNWTVSSDAETYTFNLQQGVKFSNGDPFNAYQVWTEIYGFYAEYANSSSFFYGNPLFNVSNVVFGPATQQLLNQSGLANPSPAALQIMENQSWPVYVTGPYTVVFHLEGPFLYFLGELSSTLGGEFDAQYVLEHGGFTTSSGGTSTGYFTLNAVPGTGPYVITAFQNNAYMIFKKNPTYWGANMTQSQIAANPIISPGSIENVIVNYKPDDISRYTDLSDGQAQIATIFSQDWPLVQANPNKYSYFVLPAKNSIVYAITFNTNLYPTNITDVRLAIAHAINYSLIYQNVFHNLLHPWVGPEVPLWPQYYDLGNYSQYSYNVTLAQQLLNESGVKNMPTLSFSIVSGISSASSTAQIVQAQLQQNLGINVNIEVLTYAGWLTPYTESATYRAENPNQSASMSYLGGQYYGDDEATPAAYWVQFTSVEGFDMPLFNTSLQEQVRTAFFSSTNTTYLESLVAQAQAQVYQQAPYLWLGTAGLLFGDGSIAWEKGVINDTWYGPDTGFGAANSIPLFNTVNFVS